MELHAPGRLSPAFGSCPKLKLFAVLSISGPDGWKMRLPVHWGSQFPIIQYILSSMHQQSHYMLPMSVSEPAANLEREGAPSDHLWRCLWSLL